MVIEDQSGRKVAQLSEYLGHQTNNFAEYQGLIAALEYALQHGPKALKLISDSELLVRQIKGIYKVKNLALKDLHARAQELIAQLEWFSIGHALREHNQEADRLANEAMDKGTGRVARAPSPANLAPGMGDASVRSSAASQIQQEFEGIVRNGVVELQNGNLPEGTRSKSASSAKAAGSPSLEPNALTAPLRYGHAQSSTRQEICGISR